jgi:hypothetical protein
MAVLMMGNGTCLIDRGNHFRSKRKNVSNTGFAFQKMKSHNTGSVNIGLATFLVVLFGTFFILGAFYLYQVNNIATKGSEIKEVENKIKDLEKESQKLKIKEVELKSMYNIEKSIKDLNLVSPSDVSYVEMNGPIAMK